MGVVSVDFIYRNIEQVERVLEEGRRGVWRHDYEQQPQFGPPFHGHQQKGRQASDKAEHSSEKHGDAFPQEGRGSQDHEERCFEDRFALEDDSQGARSHEAVDAPDR